MLTIYNDSLIFQDDNDPKHRAKKTTNLLKSHNIKHLEWPPSSPDLNPIENCWSLMKTKISKSEISDMGDLRGAIIDAWNSIEYHIIFNLISSMPIRIAEVIKNNGDIIDY